MSHYNVKVPNYDWTSKSIENIFTLDDTKRIMEITGVTEFTLDGHTSLLKSSSDFISKILSTAIIYTEYKGETSVRVEHVCQALVHHNLKFYGIGEMCTVQDMQFHPTELLTQNFVYTTYNDEAIPGTFYEKTNLIENFEKNGGFEESEYDSDDVIDSDEESTTSSNLNLKNYSSHKSVNEIKNEVKQDLEVAQEVLDSMTDDELGQEEEEECEISSTWEIDGDYCCLQKSTSSLNDMQIFSRKKFTEMYQSLCPTGLCVDFSPAALSMFHQVFLNYIAEQCSDNGPLKNEICRQVLKWKVAKLEKECGSLKKENRDLKERIEGQQRDKRRKVGEKLQGHFDIVDLTSVTP